MRFFILLLVVMGCASSVVVKQDKCRGTNVYLSETSSEISKKELVWMPFAPFSRVEEELFKNYNCPRNHMTTLLFKDDFLSTLISSIPFFSQTGIFYIH
jgi:hypothetical protein